MFVELLYFYTFALLNANELDWYLLKYTHEKGKEIREKVLFYVNVYTHDFNQYMRLKVLNLL